MNGLALHVCHSSAPKSITQEARKQMALKDITKEQLEGLYVNTDMNVSEIADTLGVGLSSVYKLLDKYKIPRRHNAKPVSKKAAPKAAAEIPLSKLRQTYYDTNLSIHQVASRLGISLNRLYSLINEHNLQKRRGGLSSDPVIVEQIIQSAKRGESLRTMAKSFGMSHETIRIILVERGINVSDYKHLDRDKLYDLRVVRNMTLKEIANHPSINSSPYLVYKYLNQYGIECSEPAPDIDCIDDADGNGLCDEDSAID
jgi:transposase